MISKNENDNCVRIDYCLFTDDVKTFNPNMLLLETLKEKPILKVAEVVDVNKYMPIKIDEECDIWHLLNRIESETESTASERNSGADTSTDSEFDSSTSSSERITGKCDYCHELNALVEDASKGIIVCRMCGKVDDIVLDYNPEWKQYNNEDGRGDGGNRCGYVNNIFMPISSMGTNIAGPSYNRLKMIQRWNSMAYKERSLNYVLEYIDEKCSTHGIQKNIIDTAKHLYKKVLDCKHLKGPSKGKNIIIRGINRQSLIAACVQKACEENNSPRNNKEMAEIFSCDVRRITRGTKKLENLLRDSNQNELFDMQSKVSPTHYITRYGTKLALSKNHIEMAIQIANNCGKMKLTTDNSAESVAAGSIVIMGEFKKIQIDKKKLAQIFIISDVTIAKICKKIHIYKNILIDDGATDHMVKVFKLNPVM
jgi:transcription initiation factor TFIIB